MLPWFLDSVPKSVSFRLEKSANGKSCKGKNSEQSWLGVKDLFESFLEAAESSSHRVQTEKAWLVRLFIGGFTTCLHRDYSSECKDPQKLSSIARLNWEEFFNTRCFSSQALLLFFSWTNCYEVTIPPL